MEEITSQMEEGLALEFTTDELLEAGKEFRNVLVVKLVGNRGFNRAAFKSVLRQIWNPVDDLNFTEVEGNVLIAKFNNEADRDIALYKGPWRFMGSAIQVDKWIPCKQLSELFSGKLQIWVQIHNLPVEYRNKVFALRFAEKAGKVIQSPYVNEGKTLTEEGQIHRDEVRKYVKFKV